MATTKVPDMSEAKDYLTSSKATLLRQWFVTNIRKISWSTIAIFMIGIILSAALRYSLLGYKSLDYYASLKPWYNTIKSQGFSAFATDFSNYNPPYLYLLYLIIRFLPDTPVVIAVKLSALIADFICAYFVYLIVRLKYTNGLAPLAAGMIVLFAPSVALNSAFWGQADSLFTAGLLACTYFLMTRRHALAFLAYGIALAFKLQAVFLAPLLLALFLRKEVSWKYFLIVPAILISALIPAWIAGRPISELLNIYLFQTSQYETLTMNAASIYAWLPTSKQVFNLFYLPGVIAGVTMAFMFATIVYKGRNNLTQPLMLELALLIILLIPFFLPKMHERYFYPADIFSIAFAFYYPQLFYIPILVNGVSFLSYQPFLFERDLVQLPILTAVLLVVIGVLLYDAAIMLYSSSKSEEAIYHIDRLQKNEQREAQNTSAQEI